MVSPPYLAVTCLGHGGVARGVAVTASVVKIFQRCASGGLRQSPHRLRPQDVPLVIARCTGCWVLCLAGKAVTMTTNAPTPKSAICFFVFIFSFLLSH